MDQSASGRIFETYLKRTHEEEFCHIDNKEEDMEVDEPTQEIRYCKEGMHQLRFDGIDLCVECFLKEKKVKGEVIKYCSQCGGALFYQCELCEFCLQSHLNKKDKRKCF